MRRVAPGLCVTLNKSGRVRVWLQARVRQCERDESLEFQYCTQIISDYSHVCDQAGILFKLKRARKLNLPSRSNQAHPARWISKSGCLYFRGTMVGFNTQTFVYFYNFFLIFACFLSETHTPSPNKSIWLPHIFYNSLGYLAFYSHLSEYHTHCLIFLCLGLHIIFSFTVSASSIMH